MFGCQKCQKLTASLFLLAGLGFLFQDWKSWSFWGLSWYSVLFVILGVTGLGVAHCKDCQAVMGTKKK